MVFAIPRWYPLINDHIVCWRFGSFVFPFSLIRRGQIAVTRNMIECHIGVIERIYRVIQQVSDLGLVDFDLVPTILPSCFAHSAYHSSA